jgi:hypothetical protein
VTHDTGGGGAVVAVDDDGFKRRSFLFSHPLRCAIFLLCFFVPSVNNVLPFLQWFHGSAAGGGVVVAGDGSRRGTILLPLCAETLVSFFLFYFCSIFSSLYLKIIHLCFSIFPLFFVPVIAPSLFFLFFKIFSCPLFFLLCLSIFIGRGREAYLVLSSHGDRVRWPGRPLCRRLQDFSPLYFHLGTSRGVGLVSFLVLGRERKREKIQGSKPLLSMPLRIQGKKKQYSAVQNSTVSVLFLGWKK